MSRLEVAIAGRLLFATGDVLLSARLALLLRDHAGTFHPDTVLIESGTEITTYPAYEAKRLGLPMPLRANSGARFMQTGLEVRSG